MNRSTSLAQVLSEAADIARETGQRLSSGHVLLALFTVRNRAESFLLERGIDEDRLLAHMHSGLDERDGALSLVLTRAEQLAAGCGSNEVDCLHVVAAMTRTPDCSARRLFVEAKAHLEQLSSAAMREVTESMPRWLADESLQDAPVRVRRGHRPSRKSVVSGPAARARRPANEPPRARPQPETTELPIETHVPTTPPSPWDVARTEIPRPALERETMPPPDARSMFAAATSRPSRVERVSVLEPGEELLIPTADVDDYVEDSEPPEPNDQAARWRLSPGKYPWLTSLARNLSVEAAEGKIEKLVGRQKELDSLIDILGKKYANNPCLIGEPGVGKTALVETLALKLTELPGSLGDKIVLALEVGSLLVGTHLRGAFSEKLQGIREEVQRSNARVVIFFDELHTLVGAGASGDGALDAANELKTALSRGQFPCIGATTPAEWKKHVETDPALKRRFYPVTIGEPTIEEAELMLANIASAFSAHHGIRYADGAIKAAVRMSSRFMPDRHLPDKAIALIDLAGSRAARSGRTEVLVEDLAVLVAEHARIPKERVLASDKERLLKLERLLADEIVGHTEALQRIADVIRRNAAGFSGKRPQASFLFLGPSGVGKTETAKAIARILFGSEDALIAFDLSEYSEPHSVARLIGAPPGYVGHDSGGQLTDAVRRRPGCVLLLDEIEKAHRDVLQIFLQVLDEGRVTDSKGVSVAFAETIVVMTSNLGAESFDDSRSIGFSGPVENAGESREAKSALEKAKRALAPELWARVQERLVFAPLKREEVREIARRLARASSERLAHDRGIRFELDDAALEMVVRQGGFDARFGARPMRQVLARIVESPIASRILEGRIHAGEQVQVSTRENGGLVFFVTEETGPLSLSQRPMQL